MVSGNVLIAGTDGWVFWRDPAGPIDSGHIIAYEYMVSRGKVKIFLLVWYCCLAGFMFSEHERYLKLACFLKGYFCESFGDPSPIGGDL